jgi:hypothetical protein
LALLQALVSRWNVRQANVPMFEAPNLKNLIRLGISHGQAYAWSRTRMGGWAVAQSPILGTTITLKRLMQRGYESMLTYYEKVSPQLNEPLYTRPVRTVV